MLQYGAEKGHTTSASRASGERQEEDVLHCCDIFGRRTGLGVGQVRTVLPSRKRGFGADDRLAISQPLRPAGVLQNSGWFIRGKSGADRQFRHHLGSNHSPLLMGYARALGYAAQLCTSNSERHDHDDSTLQR